MAAPTVTFEGFGIINNADAITNWSGGGSQDTDSEIQGSACIGTKASNATVAFAYDASADAGQPLNFNTTHLGQHVFVWLNCLTPNLATKSAGGLRIRVGSDAVNYGDWYVGGDGTQADDSYRGGWKNFVINPSRNFDAVAGTFITSSNPSQLTAVDFFGGVISTVGTIMGNFNNALIDQIGVGTGLRLVDGDTAASGTIDTLITSDEGTKNNKYGVSRIVSGVNLFQGKIIIGRAVGTSSTYFEDQSKLIVFENANVADTFYEVKVQDASGSATTTCVWGTISGSITTNGVFFNAAGTRRWTLTSELTGSSSLLAFYASTLQRIRTANLSSRCVFRDCNIINSGQWEVNGASIVSCSFAAGSGSAQLKVDSTSEMDNIAYCSIANGNRGIELTATGTYSFNNINFAGNVFDVRNNSNGVVTINVVGGNTPTVENIGGSSTIVVNSITITLTGLQPNSEVRVYEAGTVTEIDGVEDSGTSFSFIIDATQAVDIRMHHVSYQHDAILNFQPGETTTIPVQQTFDRNYLNP